MSNKNRTRLAIIITYTLVFLSLYLDSIIGLGYAGWLLYLFPLFFISPMVKKRHIFAIVALSSVVMPIGFILSPDGPASFFVAVLNRLAGTVSLWIIAFLLAARASSYQKLQKLAAVDEAVLSNMSEALILTNTRGEIIKTNQAAINISGGPPMDIGGISLLSEFDKEWELYNLEGHRITLQDWPLAQVTQHNRFEKVVMKVVCHRACVEWYGSFSGAPVYDSEGNLIFGIVTFRNVTESITTQNALKEARMLAEKHAAEVEEKGRILEALMKHIPEGIFIAESEQTAIRYASRHTEELFNINVDDITRSNENDLLSKWHVFHGDGITPAQPDDFPLSKAIKKGEIIRNQEWVVRQDGVVKTMWINASPIRDNENRIIGAISGWYDITSRKIIERERERLLEENRRQRNFLEALIENAPVGIAVIKGKTFVFDIVNSYLRRLKEQQGIDLAGKSIREVFPEASRDGFNLIRELHRKKEAVSVREYALRYSRGQKNTFWNIDLIPLFNKNEEIEKILVIASDSTEQVEIRRNIEIQAARYQAIINNIDEGLIVADPKGTITEMNPAAIRQHDFPESDINKEIREYFKFIRIYSKEGSLLPANEWPLARAVNGENIKSSLFRVRNQTGKEWYALASSTPVQATNGEFILAVLTLHEITEQIYIEEQLRRERNFISAILETAGALVVVFDSEGKVLLFNRACEEITGYNYNEVKGKIIWDTILRPEERGRVKKLFRMLCDGKEIPAEVENYWVTKSGEQHYIRWRNSVLKEDGKVCHVIGTGIDITDRIEAEKEINMLNAQLANRASQLEATNKELEAFAYSVSHDLRAPLRIVKGFSEVLEHDLGPKLQDPEREYLTRVKIGADKMGELIEDMLGLSRINRQEMNVIEVDLSKMVQDMAQELCSSNHERKTEIVIQHNVTAYADPHLIRIALDNLIRNAWKFSSKKEITRIEFGKYDSDGETIYYIRDYGAGFNMQMVERLFQPFQRLHAERDFRGTGIGLATVMRIIRRHNGRIWAKSAVGEGATFYFTLNE